MSDIVQDPAQKLAYMARQIADFFRAYPEEQAATAIAEHINSFWSARMRDDLLAADVALDPLVAKARGMIRSGRKAMGEDAR